MTFFNLSTTLFISSLVSLAASASQVVFSNSADNLRQFGLSRDPLSAANQTFDYIIVGGGLTGLTVAGRLSEDPSVTVLVIEAGEDQRKNSTVYDIYNYGDAISDKSNLLWHFPTDQGRGMLGGKTLGGGSSINGATWTRGAKVQYDAMQSLLEDSEASVGWNFEKFFPYMKKAEGFTAPNEEQKLKGANSIPNYHGNTGPVQVGFPKEMFGGPQQHAFVESVRNLTKIPLSMDLNGGYPTSVSFVPNSINSHEWDHRSSSAESHLTPVQNQRHGWLTLVSHRVTKIILNGTAPEVEATGVEFKSESKGKDGPSFKAFAQREVILAAGAIHTPQLLQLSGIGNSSLLSKKPFEIKTFVDLPTVGRNLQEQPFNALGHSPSDSNKFDPMGRGPSDCIAFPSINQLFTNGAGANSDTAAEDVKNRIRTQLSTWAASQAGHALSADALAEIYKIQADLIVNKSVPVIEMFYDTGYPDKYGIMMWSLLPFSRGSVTIKSLNPFEEPQSDVNYFSVDVDLEIQVAGARLSRRVLNGTSFKGMTAGETYPGITKVPADNSISGTDEQWRSWIKSAPSNGGFNPVSHPVGTAAMMKRSLGGVVDARLKVYDTLNLRVVDASILPLQISAHLSSTLYGVAEKAADMIKEDNKAFTAERLGI
ncbi:alcohol oxidase [Schizopora paradoxa]|uniref:Alcohol oxidase n=1 Tax=Schizopora paradoxa TaxID=27342 RepID=A0A0H2RXC7_9AGAM|nr:alcohol oxidase [Schizopora paradoxa]